MMSRVVLACLVLGLAVAQQEFIQYTAGVGGEECGKDHRCIKDISSCERSVNGFEMCQCKDNLRGNAKIACFPEPDENLWVQNDPHVKNFYKEFSSIQTPCAYRLLNLQFLPSPDISANVQLYGENMLFKEGEYYLTKLVMVTEVNIATDRMRQVMEFRGDVYTVDRDIGNRFRYTLISKSLQMEGIAEEEIAFSPFFNYTLAVGKDEVNNLLQVEIFDLGVKLLFRPPSIQERLDNKMLPMVPGAVFNVDSYYWKFVQIDQSDYEIASWPQGPSLTEAARLLKPDLTKEQYVNFLLLNKSAENVDILDPVCKRTQEIFLNECPTLDEQLNMLEVCTSVNAEKEFLRCLTERNSPDEFRQVQKQFFQMCEISLCMKDPTECKRMKEEMPKITKCPLPKKIQALDCDGLL